MVKRLSVFLLFLCAPLIFGQLDSNSVTVNATRSTSHQPDLVVFAVNVQSGFGASLDDVVAALRPLGITGANLSGLGTGVQLIQIIGPLPPERIAPTLQWMFALPVPIVISAATVNLFNHREVRAAAVLTET